MPRIPLLIISAFFLVGGIGHFVSAELFVAIMPAYLPFHYELVILSGVFEIIGAIALQISKTRLYAAYGLIALCIAVFPANLNMALHPEQFANIPVAALYFRLPMQLVMIWFIWWSVKPERLQ